MKLNVQYRYESDIKKSNKAFTIIQNYVADWKLEMAANKTLNSFEKNCIILIFSYYRGMSLSV